MEKLNIMPNFLTKIKETILLLSDKNLVKINGNSGLWLVKANTPEGDERKNSEEALIVLTKEIDGVNYFICRR
ncbi:MAG: hypothetical protein WC264_03275 [Candidatus Paceibacterota bacterium]|jgi:hypothetical protein